MLKLMKNRCRLTIKNIYNYVMPYTTLLLIKQALNTDGEKLNINKYTNNEVNITSSHHPRRRWRRVTSDT